MIHVIMGLDTLHPLNTPHTGRQTLKNPLVTFLVPCYNYGHYLKECVDSIAGQSYAHLEIRILDDCSTDQTSEVGYRLTQEDNRVVYHRNTTNIGHLSNYNQGIDQAKGELIWLISADDRLASPTVVAEFVHVFERYPTLGFAFSRVRLMDTHGQPQEKTIPRPNYPGFPETPAVFRGLDFFKHLVKANAVPAPAAVARKSCYTSLGSFHPKLTHSGDWYNWLLFSLYYDVYYDPQPHVFYRVHQDNMHRTYEKPRHGLENTLLCYDELLHYLERFPKDVPDKRSPLSGEQRKELCKQTRLARRLYKKQHRFPLTLMERIEALIHRLS